MCGHVERGIELKRLVSTMAMGAQVATAHHGRVVTAFLPLPAACGIAGWQAAGRITQPGGALP
jgi:hypothetical protein